jgi:predicted kinase
MELGWKLKQYLDTVVSWEVVAAQYYEAYDLARSAISTGKQVVFPPEF